MLTFLMVILAIAVSPLLAVLLIRGALLFFKVALNLTGFVVSNLFKFIFSLAILGILLIIIL